MGIPPLIAIVDDDNSLLAALVRLVRSFGYEAQGFPSAEALIASDIVSICACVVTDIHMPGMSGIELACLLTRRRPPLPVIAITARSEQGMEESAMANGVSFFLRKPVDIENLAGCLERALAK